MHLADAFIQSDLHCIQVTVSTFGQLLLSLGSSQCQLSNFVAKFSNFSDYPNNFFFQKHLATNLAILKIYLATYDKWLKW